MKSRVVVAAVQMHSTTDVAANLATAERLVGQAAAGGAELVVLPELFPCIGEYAEMATAAEPIPGSLSDAMSRIARENQVTLLAGSIAWRASEQGKCRNTSLLLGPDGAELARYSKIHLFDIDLPGGPSLRESQWFAPGSEVATVETSLGKIGLAICYDLRFPELFRQLADQGAEIILVPAAFTAVTGRAHWDLLVRARAVENQAFVIAANQFGQHSPGLATFGHSMIVDPWGDVLAAADGDAEGVVRAELDAARLEEVRRRLPALGHRRLQ